MKTLEQKLNELAESDLYPFHMPGHKRRAIPASIEAAGREHTEAERALSAAASVDITEIDGFDNLHAPESVLADEMAFAARLYGTHKTYFLVNGSTVGLLAAISAAVPFGGSILIERGCHIAVYHAICLRHLEAQFLTEDVFRVLTESAIRAPGGEAAEKEAESCGRDDAHAENVLSHVSAIVITSPTYEGLKKDISACSRLAERLGAVLIVDEAHGAHFSMHPYFPQSAAREGADLVIQSTHKTLPCLTQTALLHNVTGKVPGDAIERFLDIYETSSPSYLLVSSITCTLHALSKQENSRIGFAGTYFESYVENLKKLRTNLSEMKVLHLAGGKEAVIEPETEELLPGTSRGMRLDPGKILILTDPSRSGMTGPELYDLLRLRFHLQPEMKTLTSVLLMTSVSDTEEGFARLSEALFAIDAELAEEIPQKQMCDLTAAMNIREAESFHKSSHERTAESYALPERVLSMAEAYEAETESVPLTQTAGRVSADFIIVYPPDSPVIVPGELFTEELCRHIFRMEKSGLYLTGIRDGRVKVVRQA